MYGTCSDSARVKINSYAAAFQTLAENANKTELVNAIGIMRGQIGTKKPYNFPEIPEPSRNIAIGFWNPTVAAYAFCRDDQHVIVASTIAQTLDRLEVLLERENE